MKGYFFVLLFALTSSCLAADPQLQPQPKSPAAKTAIAKYDRGMKDAEAAYRKACTDATTKAIEELTKAQKEAMTSQNLKEANLIDDKILDLKDTLKRLLDGVKESHAGASNLLDITGRWQVSLTYGFKGVYVIDDSTIRLEGKSDQTARYERHGREIRYLWPSGDTGHIIFDDEVIKVEIWEKGKKPFEGTPTRAGTLRRL